MRILLIEDEPEIAEFIKKGFKEEQFVVDWAPTAEKGLLLAKTNNYDCGVFDINLVGGPVKKIRNANIGAAAKADIGKDDELTGIDICRAIREKGKVFPVIMLSVLRDADIKVKALDLGADDYLTKPFLFAELLARVRALMRREKTMASPVLKVADLTLDTLAHAVTRDGKILSLNRKEFALLEYFMRNPGTLLTRSMILDHVWDAGTDELTNTVDVHVSFLRRKVDRGRKKKILKTVHGYGYKLDINGERGKAQSQKSKK